MLPGTGLGLDLEGPGQTLASPAAPCLLAGGPGHLHSLKHCVSWVSRPREQTSRPCRLSVERGSAGCQTMLSPVKAVSRVSLPHPSLPSG